MSNQLLPACTAFFFAALFACNQQPANAPAASPGANAPKPMSETNKGTGELDSARAVAAIDWWDQYRGALQQWLKSTSLPNLADEIPTGFWIPSQDAHSIDSIARVTNRLYAMLALQENDKTRKVELTLIFRVPDHTGTLRYYDFSEPCPPCNTARLAGSGELDAARALAAINLWDQYRGSLQQWLKSTSLPYLADELPIGFWIPSQDMHSIDSVARGTNQLFAELALEATTSSTVYLSLIFRAPNRAGALKYYDFSEPCPPCEVREVPE